MSAIQAIGADERPGSRPTRFFSGERNSGKTSDRSLGGFQSCLGCFGDNKNPFSTLESNPVSSSKCHTTNYAIPVPKCFRFSIYYIGNEGMYKPIYCGTMN